VTLAARLLALWLAAIWLPLTMHCQLAGFQNRGESSICCEDHCGCSGGGDCHSDACKIIESGNYFLKKVLLAVPGAPFFWIESLEPMACRRLVMPLAILTEATGAPPGWPRVWQFVFRAAPAPRAPSAVC
jgi:hypothetical protein